MKFKLKLLYLAEWSALFVVVWLIVHTEHAVAEIYGREIDFDDSQFGKSSVYFTLNATLNALRKREHNNTTDNDLAYYLLTTFRSRCLVVNMPFRATKQKPFIAIEANSFAGRFITARRFTRLVRGVMFTNPPPCLKHMKKLFSPNSPLTNVYYTLGIYVISFNANVNCNFKPVVTTGYWYEQITFWLRPNSANTSLPPNTSTIYDFPEDLKVPDLMFYINFPDDLSITPQITRSQSEWKHRKTMIMRMLRGVPMFELSSRMGFDNLVIAMKNITREILGKTHDISF